MTDLINASAKEEAEEAANGVANISFEKYLKQANIILDSRSTALRHMDSSRLGDRSISSRRFVSKGEQRSTKYLINQYRSGKHSSSVQDTPDYSKKLRELKEDDELFKRRFKVKCKKPPGLKLVQT